MIFPDILHFSADREVRQFLKKGDIAAAWEKFADILAVKRQSFDISHYSRYTINGNKLAAGNLLAKTTRSDRFQTETEKTGHFDGVPSPFPASISDITAAVRYVAGVWEMLQTAHQTAVSDIPSWNDTIEEYIATATKWMATPQEDSTHPVTTVLRQILGGELGFLLGNLLSELTPTRELLAVSQNFLNTSILELLDGGGLLPARYLPWTTPLLSSWTRAAMLGNMMDVRPWKTAAQKQYEWMILQTLRQLRHDGTLVFSPPATDHSPEQRAEHHEFLQLVQDSLELDTDPIDSRVGVTVLPRCRPLHGIVKKHITPDLLPPSAYFSDWAAVAVMKPSWNHTNTWLTTMFDGAGDTPIEILIQRQRLFSGNWSFHVEKDGVPLLPTAPWSCLCELEEPSHLYMELEIPLEQQYVLQRHFFLAKEDSILMLADSILAPEDSSVPPPPKVYCDTSPPAAAIGHSDGVPSSFPSVSYRSAIPLADGTSAVPCEKGETQKKTMPREKILSQYGWEFRHTANSSPLAKMVPLWSPNNEMSCLVQNGTFQVTATTSHPSLFVPMVFDWKKNRIPKPAIWRSLTVGESLQVVSPQRAVGYRIQFGKTQFLLYRSLAGTANRTVFGHNLVSDLLFARFDRTTSKVHPVLEIEADDE